MYMHLIFSLQCMPSGIMSCKSLINKKYYQQNYKIIKLIVEATYNLYRVNGYLRNTSTLNHSYICMYIYINFAKFIIFFKQTAIAA